MKAFSLRWALLLPLWLLGCDEPPEPGTKVDSFRVLAEQVDLPYARPGETVTLTSLAFDPAGRKVSWLWASCVNPSETSLQGCLDGMSQAANPEQAIFAMGDDLSRTSYTLPSDVLEKLPLEARGRATVGIVSAACPGDLRLGEGAGGLPFRCTDAESGQELGLDELIVGLKRINVRQSDRNQNPEIARVTFDGADWPADELKEVGWCDTDKFQYGSCSKKEQHQLAAVVSEDSFERGKSEFGRDFVEQLVVQFYSTEGIFENVSRIAAEPKNGWVARKAASGKTLTLWFVARDDRGGVTWTERQVKVR